MDEKRVYTYWRNDKPGLDEVITDIRSALSDGRVLLMSPDSFELTNIEKMASRDLERVYEARIFGNGTDVRWVMGSGVAVFSEQELDLDGYERAVTPYLETTEPAYFMWGKVENNQLQEYQIQPVDLSEWGDFPDGSKLVLRVKEYLGKVDDFGNVGVVATIIRGVDTIGGSDE